MSSFVKSPQGKIPGVARFFSAGRGITARARPHDGAVLGHHRPRPRRGAE